jgi:hypothetical protein
MLHLDAKHQVQLTQVCDFNVLTEVLLEVVHEMLLARSNSAVIYMNCYHHELMHSHI